LSKVGGRRCVGAETTATPGLGAEEVRALQAGAVAHDRTPVVPDCAGLRRIVEVDGVPVGDANVFVVDDGDGGRVGEINLSIAGTASALEHE
jgi:hypothetical protein